MTLWKHRSAFIVVHYLKFSFQSNSMLISQIKCDSKYIAFISIVECKKSEMSQDKEGLLTH